MPSRTSSTPQTIWAKNKALCPLYRTFSVHQQPKAAGDFHYSAHLHVLDDECDYTEKLSPAAGRDFYRHVGRILWQQAHLRTLFIQPLDGELSVYGDYDDSPVGYSGTAVYHQHITIVYACARHAVATSPNKVGRSRVADTELVQIQGAIQFSSRRRGEACRYAFCKERYAWCFFCHVAAV